MDMVALCNWIGVSGMFVGVVVFGLHMGRSHDKYSHQDVATQNWYHSACNIHFDKQRDHEMFFAG